MNWHRDLPKSSGDYLVIEKPWRSFVVAYYCPSMKQPWCMHGRWYPHDAIEAWDHLPPLPLKPLDDKP
jgi:hypothetical protein